jgi:hypothetical protein
MAARQLNIAVVVGGAALALAASGCGGDGAAAERMQIQSAETATRAKIDRLVHEGKLPPVARRLVNPNGTVTVNFIDGPNRDRDVVRSGPDGTTGSKLAWDLNGDGRIAKAERTITERELYDATLGSR